MSRKTEEKETLRAHFCYRCAAGFFCLWVGMGCAHVAQLVERILGKDEVSSSNLLMGSSNRF